MRDRDVNFQTWLFNVDSTTRRTLVPHTFSPPDIAPITPVGSAMSIGLEI